MAKRKSTKKYYFSVEGETEQWYLKWLQDIINKTERSVYKVSFDCPVQKNPLKHAKSLVVTGKTEVYHLSDYESDEPIHVQQFTEVMDNMKKAKGLGDQILIVDGDAGSGKSALIKQAMANLSDKTAFLAFKSTDMDVDDKLKFLTLHGTLTIDEVFDVYKEADNRIVYIDAVEKYFVLEKQQIFEEILQVFMNAGWKLVLTIRTAYKESFHNLLLYNLGLRLPFGLKFAMQPHPPNRLIKFLFVGSRILLHHFLHPCHY